MLNSLKPVLQVSIVSAAPGFSNLLVVIWVNIMSGL